MAKRPLPFSLVCPVRVRKLDKVSPVVLHLLYRFEDVVYCAVTQLLFGTRLVHFVVPASAEMFEGRDIYDLIGEIVCQLWHKLLKEPSICVDRVSGQGGHLETHIELSKELKEHCLSLIHCNSGLTHLIK